MFTGTFLPDDDAKQDIVRLVEWNMRIATKICPWPTTMHRASINSFGYGGANAHAIIESADSFLPHYKQSCRERENADPTVTFLLPFSAATVQSLEARVLDLAGRLQEGQQYGLRDLCYTLADRRSRLSEKGFLLVSGANIRTDVALEKLCTPKQALPRSKFGFVFTGQAAQWPQVGRQLLEKSPTFARTIDRLDSVLRILPEAPPWTIKEALLEPAATSKLGDAGFSQPLCTAVQLRIVNVLHSWNVNPAVVVGHSSGEIAAAYAASLLDEAQAIIIAFYRGYTAVKITSEGSMLAVAMSCCYETKICVACVNSPESVTLSGSAQSIDKITGHLSKQGIFVRKLSTGGRAYHSSLMEEVGAEYERLLSKALNSFTTLEGEEPARVGTDDNELVRFFSSVGRAGDALSSFSRGTTSLLQPCYWRKNLEQPVQFNTAVENLVATGSYHLIEIGPHSALQLPIQQIRAFLGVCGGDLPYHPTLLRGKDADVCMKALAGDLYLLGQSIDLLAVNGIDSSERESGGVTVIHDLPSYNWTYGPLLWKEPRSSVGIRNRERVRHELLGSETVAASRIERSWRNILKTTGVLWLHDHLVNSGSCALEWIYANEWP